MVEEACKNLSGVSASQVEMQSNIQFYDGITTDEIQQILIKSASDLISLEAPNYQYVAARLLLFSLRKSVHGKLWEHPPLLDHIKNCVSCGVYDEEILSLYSEDDLLKVESYIDYNRDFLFTYCGLRQIYDKYLVQDRKNNIIYETPQFMYIMVSLILFSKYPKENRLTFVKKYYDAISTFKVNIPTPIMAGVRTNSKQFASCCLIDVDDTLDSIIASDGVMMKYIAGRAGIGLNVGRLRAINSKIRGGETISTGVVPFIKKFEGSLNSCHQGGLRKGSMTVYFPIWHSEIENVIVLKNNKGTEENRARRIDYNIQLSKLFYERFIKNEDITLFSPSDVPDLYETFGMPEFDDLYCKYENDQTIPSKKINARNLIIDILKERNETGRIYLMNIDHCNSHSPFKEQITMSNLCVSPETMILTTDGYLSIEQCVNQIVDVWNGEKFTTTEIKKTSDHQELVRVYIDNDYVDCTPYHKFYIVDKSHKKYSRDKKVIEKRAHELKSGDHLIKYDLPVVNGDRNLENAYALGVHSGDGSYHNGKPFVDLYGVKKSLINNLPVRVYYDHGDSLRVMLNIPDHTKFVVPHVPYSVESRLNWFAGLVDTDGCISKNGDNQSIQIVSIRQDFLNDVRLMLQTLGVNSKVCYFSDSGLKKLPNGKGGYKEYMCKKAYRIIISSSGLHRLCNLGFHNMLNLKKVEPRLPQRNAERFNVVRQIEWTGRFSSTYCFTEKDRGMGMFNGFLLGNCTEILLPTKPIQNLNDDDGEIALCILSALNVGKIKSDEELEKMCDIAVRALDELIDYQEYPVKAAELSAKRRRTLGVGIIGLAHYLAKHNVNYEDPRAVEIVHKLAESIQYYLMVASNNLAKERGACEYFNRTTYSDGVLPIDTYKKEIDDICKVEYQHDWEELRQNILKYGMRHSTLSCIMPSESCLFWEHKVKTSNGFMNFHQIAEYGGLDWKNIELSDAIGWYDMEPSIKVETQNGYQNVDKLYFNGKKEVMKITLENNKVIKCTSNHRFLIRREDETVEWKRVYELCEGDDIVEFK